MILGVEAQDIPFITQSFNRHRLLALAFSKSANSLSINHCHELHCIHEAEKRCVFFTSYCLTPLTDATLSPRVCPLLTHWTLRTHRECVLLLTRGEFVGSVRRPTGAQAATQRLPEPTCPPLTHLSCTLPGANIHNFERTQIHKYTNIEVNTSNRETDQTHPSPSSPLKPLSCGMQTYL